MACLSPQTLFSLSKPTKPNSRPFTTYNSLPSKLLQSPIFSSNKQRNGHLTNKKKNKWVVYSVMQEELDVIPVQSQDSTDMQEGVVVGGEDDGTELVGQASPVGGFSDGTLSFEGFSSASASSSSSTSIGERGESEDIEKMVDTTINATLVLAAGTFAITKLLTIDSDYWQGWTIYEILRYTPQHNWSAYEEALKTNPVLAKMMISGVVYSLGDWIAQCYEAKPLFEFDRARMFRSGLVGFTLHGSLSHCYYQFCEAGWKLWPFAHLITYGLIPVERRLLWVDCIELVQVTILSSYSNEKSEARISEARTQVKSNSSLISPPEVFEAVNLHRSL